MLTWQKRIALSLYEVKQPKTTLGNHSLESKHNQNDHITMYYIRKANDFETQSESKFSKFLEKRIPYGWPRDAFYRQDIELL